MLVTMTVRSELLVSGVIALKHVERLIGLVHRSEMVVYLPCCQAGSPTEKSGIVHWYEEKCLQSKSSIHCAYLSFRNKLLSKQTPQTPIAQHCSPTWDISNNR
jgi:hypothetical protein